MISVCGRVDACEIENLREAVGWERNSGTYESIRTRLFSYCTARDENGMLIGYVSVLSDGIADAFIADLLVHPAHQKRGLGKALVAAAVEYVREAGVECIQVVFDDELESFYWKCGFSIYKSGIIDFRKNR